MSDSISGDAASLNRAFTALEQADFNGVLQMALQAGDVGSPGTELEFAL